MPVTRIIEEVLPVRRIVQPERRVELQSRVHAYPVERVVEVPVEHRVVDVQPIEHIVEVEVPVEVTKEVKVEVPVEKTGAYRLCICTPCFSVH